MYTIYDIDSFSKEEYLDFFIKLLLSHYVKDIEQILAQPDPTLYYSIVVEFSMILEGDINFGPLFIAEPRKLLPIFNEGLFLAQQRVLSFHNANKAQQQQQQDSSNKKQQTVFPSSGQSTTSSIGGGRNSHLNNNSSNYTLKKNCRVRVCDLPICKEINSSSLPKSTDIGLFIEMRGTIIRTGQSKILEKSKFFQCAKCQYLFEVFIDFEQFNQFHLPKKCPNPDGNCCGTFFNPTKGIGDHCDYQEIKLQEQIHQLGAGSIPRSILILLQEDLVDQCQAGDDIVVSGIVIRRWKPLKEDERCDIEVVVIANYIRVMNEQKFISGMTDEIRNQFEEFWIENEQFPLVGRNKILSHICPGVYGLFVVKLSLLLVLIGGVHIHQKERNLKTRGECHLLLVGEPGTGKSQFLKYAAKLASRSVLTTGIGTTTAGLTASAVRENGGEMVLEAGALVLADGGVCCIDEFSGIKEADRATIHEAMEQQTLSIAKAGVISKLHTRTSIIAATNSKGKYDHSESLCVNTNLASPLLSRFDIILLLTDNLDTAWDTLVSDFILKQSIYGNVVDTPMKTDPNSLDFWNLDMLQSYIYYVKSAFQPKLSQESKKLLEVYYHKQRQTGNLKNEGRTTVRLLESLIRLSQAHARLMFRNIVEVQDAIVAIFMIESSVESSCILSGLDAQHSIFPDDPDADYKKLERFMRNSLGLSNITHKSAPRKKSKPKPSNHTTNDNWVNANYDDDNEEEVEEEQEQEEQDEVSGWGSDDDDEDEEEEEDDEIGGSYHEMAAKLKQQKEKELQQQQQQQQQQQKKPSQPSNQFLKKPTPSMSSQIPPNSTQEMVLETPNKTKPNTSLNHINNTNKTQNNNNINVNNNQTIKEKEKEEESIFKNPLSSQKKPNLQKQEPKESGGNSQKPAKSVEKFDDLDIFADLTNFDTTSDENNNNNTIHHKPEDDLDDSEFQCSYNPSKSSNGQDKTTTTSSNNISISFAATLKQTSQTSVQELRTNLTQENENLKINDIVNDLLNGDDSGWDDMNQDDDDNQNMTPSNSKQPSNIKMNLDDVDLDLDF